MFKKIFFAIVLITFIACNGSNTGNTDNKPTENPPPPAIAYTIIKAYPHNTKSFTEGLFWHDNALYESTGNNGESKLMKINLETGNADKEVKIPDEYFGEGISMMNGKIYQLTWKEHKVFVYDSKTFEKTSELAWPFEGWGMTHNDSLLIISTGSSNIYFVDPKDFSQKRILAVTNNYGPVSNINELEYVDGYIYANLYQTNYILKINTETGKVEAQMDLTGILDRTGKSYNADGIDVLNGIAYNPASKTFYVTGKYWPALFEIQLQ
ncbi:MAG TPA: glutaminyl-peptide cyclotransferase [Chitinophagaceae bacterium]|nr:glutaminyl-peptide cyclotransferase [Chitinophagaceae bacterium]